MTPFYGEQVLRLFDHTEETIVSSGIGAERTGILFGDMKTARTESDVPLQFQDRIGQGHSAAV